MTKDNDPLFPEIFEVSSYEQSFTVHTNHGATLREHYAGLAMTALIAQDVKDECGPHDIAWTAVEYADALLNALANKPFKAVLPVAISDDPQDAPKNAEGGEPFAG